MGIKNISTSLFVALTCALAPQAQALTIHAAEMGIGKFHRQDNRVHAYADNNAWKAFVLAETADTNANTLVVDNTDGSVTIYFASLEELLLKAQEISVARQEQIDIFNLNAHGMPGGMWFPKDAAQRDSSECRSWVEAARGSDQDNYDQYYSPISKTDVMQMRTISNQPPRHYECTTGLPEWQEIVGRHAGLQTIFAEGLQVNFLSCIVGLGTVGDYFTKGVAEILLRTTGRVSSSLMYGLGDWSMPEGMGFWDYQNQQQLSRDNAAYPVNREDREIAQNGDIRVALRNAQGQIASGLIRNVEFMFLTGDTRQPEMNAVVVPGQVDGNVNVDEVRLPGTKFKVRRLN